MTTIKQTNDINSAIYQDTLAIRKTVFVQEQGVPMELEIDENEAKATYLVAYEDEKAVGTLRFVPLDDRTVKIQRMAVLEAFRKRGIGRALMLEAAEVVEAAGYQRITLSAQLTAKGFYRTLGYHEKGDVFMDAGIKHIQMEKELSD